MAPQATTVASVVRPAGSLVTMGNFESSVTAGIISGLDSIVKSVPSLRDLGAGINEMNKSGSSTAMARLEPGQALLLDGGRRLVLVGDRLALMSGTQIERSWPAARSWVFRTGGQLISVLEHVGATASQ